MRLLHNISHLIEYIFLIFNSSLFQLILLLSPLWMIINVFLCSSLQEGAECLVSSQLLEPSLGSGEERESRPRHSQRSLPQQHHPTLRPDQRGLRTPLQKGDIFLYRSVDSSIKATVLVNELDVSIFFFFLEYRFWTIVTTFEEVR